MRKGLARLRSACYLPPRVYGHATSIFTAEIVAIALILAAILEGIETMNTTVGAPAAARVHPTKPFAFAVA